jgi:glycosyltransferase involved in cell wall biosynthesis
MNIAIEARSLSRPASGITTYARELTAALKAVGSPHQFSILDNGPTSELIVPLWLETTVPRWLQSVKPNVVHFTKPMVPHRKHYPTVITIHDVIPLLFPESQKFLPRLFWPTTLRHAARTADHIIAVSEASKKDIREQLQIDPDKITVIYEAVPANSRKAIARKSSGVNESYILFLGTIEPRKNVPLLIRAFARIAKDIAHQLVIAGRAYKGIDEVHEEIRKSGVAERIQVKDFVPAEELPALYANADLFVWPSIYEGWGFPPQEAMAAGVPVIVSNGGSLAEVVGTAGEVVSFTVSTISERAHDEVFEVALADRMKSVILNPTKQEQMRDAGLHQIQTHSWPAAAHATLKVYEQVSR